MQDQQARIGGRDLHRLTIALLIAAASAPAAAADRTIGITSFDRIKVEGPYIVTVATGKPVSAKASGDRAAAERVSLRVEGRMLVVSADRSAWGGWPGSKAGAATVTLTTPVLTSAFLVGSGSLGIDAMKSAKITLIVDGSGRMTVGSATTDRIDVSVSGAGSAVVAGIAKDAGLAVRGTAELDASRLQTSDLVITSESAGAVTAQAKRSAKVTAVGAGTVDVKGAAACTVRQLGAGPVTCGK